MASDLLLTDDSVIVVGNLGVGTDTPQRAIHAETGEIHSGGGAGGFSFANRTMGENNFFPQDGTGDRWVLYSQGKFAHLWASGPLGGNLFSVSSLGQAFITGITAGLSFGDRSLAGTFVENPTNGERWTWYAKDGIAHLRSGTDRISIQPNGFVSIGTAKAERPLHVNGDEIHSSGTGAGYSFADRSAKQFVDSPEKGERWVWYAAEGGARLWSGSDRLQVQANGFVAIGIAKAERPLHVDGDEIHSSGTGAGYSFADRSAAQFVADPAKGERWVWYAAEGNARLWSGSDRLQIQANGFVAIGIAKAERPLHVNGDEIHSSGTGAGFSFADRSTKQFVGNPKKGERWVWYAAAESARLWSGTDKISIARTGELTIGSGVSGQPYTVITPGKIVLGTGKMLPQKFGSKLPPTPEEFDLLQLLKALKAEVDNLKAEVATLKGKP